MDKIKKLFPDPVTESMWPDQEFKSRGIHIADKRVAQLLLVLHELDESLGALEELPKNEVSGLVSSALLACGFVDPVEARYAIAAILETIDVRNSIRESC